MKIDVKRSKQIQIAIMIVDVIVMLTVTIVFFISQKDSLQEHATSIAFLIIGFIVSIGFSMLIQSKIDAINDALRLERRKKDNKREPGSKAMKTVVIPVSIDNYEFSWHDATCDLGKLKYYGCLCREIDHRHVMLIRYVKPDNTGKPNCYILKRKKDGLIYAEIRMNNSDNKVSIIPLQNNILIDKSKLRINQEKVLRNGQRISVSDDVFTYLSPAENG